MENDPYSIPVNEALYTAAMEVLPDLAAFALETVRQGHPGNKKMLHMLASHYVSRDMPAQAAEVYHDLVKLDPTDSVAVKSEKDCMARATMQQQKWEEAKSFRDVMKNSAETNSLDKSDKKGLTRAELEERLGLLSARYAQNQQDLAAVRDIAGVYEQMEDWANAYSFYNYAFSLSNNDISLENKASEMNERCRKAQVEEIRRALPRSRIIRNFRNSLPSLARKLRSSRWLCAASVWKTTPRTRKPVLSWARPSLTAAITRKPFRNSSAPATTPISASAPCCCSASAMTPRTCMIWPCASWRKPIRN
ncbi:MAG: tetratricopeptide repeat protein [Akkermansia sp.]